jgi:hypothetical protein
LRQARSGVVAALNLGIRVSSGYYIARMDADDVARPHRLSRQLEELSRNPEVAVLGSNYEVIDRFGRVLRVVRMPTTSAAIRVALRSSNCIGHPTVLMRRDAVIDAGGYRQPFQHCEDYDLWLRLEEKYQLRNLDESLLLYREHRGQLTWSHLEQRIYAELAAHISARHRRAGLPDPVHDNQLITRSFLQELEMTDSDIRSEIFRRALIAAREARRARNWQFALQACALAGKSWLTPSERYKSRHS